MAIYNPIIIIMQLLLSGGSIQSIAQEGSSIPHVPKHKWNPQRNPCKNGDPLEKGKHQLPSSFGRDASNTKP